MTRIILAAALAAVAFAKPNFTGSWKMDPAKSDFGMLPMPSGYDRTVKHEDPALSVSTTQKSERGERTYDFKCSTDGKEVGTTEIMRMQGKVGAKWDGDVLVVETKAAGQQGEFTITERWKLSPDGKTATIDAKIVMPAGESPLKLVLVKQ